MSLCLTTSDLINLLVAVEGELRVAVTPRHRNELTLLADKLRDEIRRRT